MQFGTDHMAVFLRTLRERNTCLSGSPVGPFIQQVKIKQILFFFIAQRTVRRKIVRYTIKLSYDTEVCLKLTNVISRQYIRQYRYVSLCQVIISRTDFQINSLLSS